MAKSANLSSKQNKSEIVFSDHLRFLYDMNLYIRIFINCEGFIDTFPNQMILDFQ